MGFRAACWFCAVGILATSCGAAADALVAKRCTDSVKSAYEPDRLREVAEEAGIPAEAAPLLTEGVLNDPDVKREFQAQDWVSCMEARGFTCPVERGAAFEAFARLTDRQRAALPLLAHLMQRADQGDDEARRQAYSLMENLDLDPEAQELDSAALIPGACEGTGSGSSMRAPNPFLEAEG